MLNKLLLLSSLLFTSISSGCAGVTSAFIRKEWPSIDIPLNNEVFALPKGYNAPHQVSLHVSLYIQLKNKSLNSTLPHYLGRM